MRGRRPRLRPVRQDFLVFGRPHLEEEEIREVEATLRSGWIGSGPRAAELERRFARYEGAKHAAAVSSCTAALHLSMLAAGLGKGDEVITSALTFCATVNAIIHAGCTPVIADVDPSTMNIDPADVERRITKRTRAIVPVHFAGRPCDMSSLCRIARTHGLTIIEDCAHAIESEYRGRKTGTFGRFGCFSFYVTKNVVTGEGGMVIARRAADIARVRTLALHGMSHDAWMRFSDEGYRHYDVVTAGYKYNMTDLQAALGIPQLARVERSWRRRVRIWNRYLEALADLPLDLPAPPEPRTRHAHHLFTVLVDPRRAGITRDEFLAAMTEQNIGVGVHYRSIPEHAFYRERFGWRLSDYPRAVRIGRRTASLPLSPRLTDRDVDDVVRAVRAALA